eukprot:scaffold122689_cov69-Phaeocystis_antarctica.AAC.1
MHMHAHANARTCTHVHACTEREGGSGGEGDRGRRRVHKAGRQRDSAAAFVPHHPCPLRLSQVRGHPEAELQSEGRQAECRDGAAGQGPGLRHRPLNAASLVGPELLQL